MTDEIRNKDDAKGRVKEAAGSLSGDDDLKREGKVDKATGAAKDGVEKVADKVGETEATALGRDRRALRGRGTGARRADLHGRGAPLRAGPDRGSRARRLSTSTRSRSTASAAGPTRLDLPPSAIRTIDREKPLDVCFGSCRVALPHERPVRREQGRPRRRQGVRRAPRPRPRDDPRRAREWPEFLFLLGDQVYVDEGSPETRERIRERRGTDTPPGEEVTDFEEYSWLYQESWSDPLIRWLLLDGLGLDAVGRPRHERRLEHLRLLARGDAAKSWWHRRATAGIMSYWVYQHLGNLSPRRSTKTSSTGGSAATSTRPTELRGFAAEIDSTGSGSRWSFCRDLGNTRAIFVDSRAGRVLEPGERSIVDDEEWEWIVEHAGGDFDHLLISTTVPFLLSPGFHHLEAWNERVCDGAWGGLAARAAEKLRRAVDFDHWASFDHSFQQLRGLLEEVGSGERGGAPASIVVLSGDVHHAYLAEAGFGPGSRCASAVYQAVCSPYRNPLDANERRAIKAGFSRPFIAAMRGLAPARRRRRPGPALAPRRGPLLRQPGGDAAPRRARGDDQLDKTVPGEEDERRLDCVFERRLA